MENKIACCQMLLSTNKKTNLQTAQKMIRKAAKMGSELIVLPEMYICPYSLNYFKTAAEPEDGPSNLKIAQLAKELGVTIFAGSIPEAADGCIYNTCFVFGPDGTCIGKHRKMHLFDINLREGLAFQESKVLSAGNKPTLINTTFGVIGIAICFDVRFPELFRIMADRGAKLVIVPAAFNTTTGPLHWDLNLRARAVDNQCYIAACSSARDPHASYRAWGHSCIVDPWGHVLSDAGIHQRIITTTLHSQTVDCVREQLPLLSARRKDLYEVSLKD